MRTDQILYGFPDGLIWFTLVAKNQVEYSDLVPITGAHLPTIAGEVFPITMNLGPREHRLVHDGRRVRVTRVVQHGRGLDGIVLDIVRLVGVERAGSEHLVIEGERRRCREWDA